MTPPAIEPVTLAETKNHLRVDVTDDDALITALITAGRESVESFLRRVLITQTIDLFLDSFPGQSGTIHVPFPPLQSVTQISFVDTDGTTKIVDTADFLVDTATEPGRIIPSPDALTWDETEVRTNAVTVRYVAGFGTLAADVPAGIRTAILFLVSDMYEHRESQSEIKLVENRTVNNLLWTHKVPIEI